MSDLLEIFRELLKLESEKDSIEFGTPTRLARIKVYGDVTNVPVFKAKIDAAVSLAAYAAEKFDQAVPKTKSSSKDE